VQDIFDNPATLDAGNHMFDHDTAPVDILISMRAGMVLHGTTQSLTLQTGEWIHD
jgi:hypothetical protein